jgi:PAS domain S-box-containing protein
VTGTGNDHAGEARRESEERFGAVAEAVPGLLWVSSSSGHNSYVNRGFCEFTGRPFDELLGNRWLELLHPADLQRLLPLWEAATSTGQPFEAEYRLRRHDGEWHWFLARSVPQRDAEGRIVHWVGTGTDIQDMVRAREATARQQAELRHAVDEAIAEHDRLWQLSPDLFAVADGDGNWLSINPAWTRVLGYRGGELIGANRDAFIHPDDLERTREAREQLANGTPVSGLELRYRHADGSWRWLSWTAVLDGGRNYAVARDVTEQKAADERLQAAQAALAQSQKMETIGQLTGGIAHDFNNLLAAILANLELLRKRMGDDPGLHRLLDGAIQGAERGTSLTRRLLAFARRQELHPEPVDVRRLVHEMRDLLRRTLGPGIVIDLGFAEALPPAIVDAHQLELALLNLAVNARDAMPGGGRLTIAADRGDIVQAHPDGPAAGAYVRLSVTDTGLGMDADTLKRAIEPFFTTKGVGKGTGLGLAMVQGLAVQSGGGMQITSIPDEGTTVTLWLPVADGTIPKPAEPQAAEQAAPLLQPRQLKVLVVDDDVLVAMGTTAMLEDLGHVTLMAGSGTEALEVLQEHPDIELVLTDQAMPGMTGTELARRLRELYPMLPVILATGYAELAAGDGPALPRLSKPYSQQALAATIERNQQRRKG